MSAKLRGRSYTAPAGASIKRRGCSSRHWDRNTTLSFRDVSLALRVRSDVTFELKRQACKRHQSPEEARNHTQRDDAQGPDDHEPADAAELQLPCRERRHQW